MIKNDGILYIEPEGPTSSEPLIDELTRKMTASYRLGRPSDVSGKGVHTCSCGATSTPREHILPNGEETNALCIHYLAFHRDQIPEGQLAKVCALSDGEAEPNDEELQAPKQVVKQLVTHHYRINYWRHDVPKRPYSAKSFEGENVEACDEKARKWFEGVSAEPGNEWEGMDLFRIDAPAVAEKTTFLSKNGRQEGNYD